MEHFFLIASFSLAAIVVLFVALRRQKKEPLIVFEEEDIRENIITYDDEGGGEEDTEAFDIATLQVWGEAAKNQQLLFYTRLKSSDL